MARWRALPSPNQHPPTASNFKQHPATSLQATSTFLSSNNFKPHLWLQVVRGMDGALEGFAQPKAPSRRILQLLDKVEQVGQ